MKNLQTYIERKNAYASIFARPGTVIRMLDINNLTRSDMEYLASCLDGDLSPENLCCDGELRGPRLIKKAKYLNACVKELSAISKKVA